MYAQLLSCSNCTAETTNDIGWSIMAALQTMFHRSVSQNATSPSKQYIEAAMITPGIEKVSSFAELSQGWDGYDAEPIPEAVISQAINVLYELRFTPSIYPTGRGSIQFEHFEDDDNLIEVEIFSDHISCFEVKQGVETECENVNITYVCKELRKSYGRGG